MNFILPDVKSSFSQPAGVPNSLFLPAVTPAMLYRSANGVGEMIVFCIAFALAYTWGVLGISLGYHRGLSHRSFKMPVLLEYFFVLGGYFVFEGGPIFWVASHRLHHRYSDRPGDPHSPNDGAWHAFLGWMSKPVVKISEEEYKVLCPDLFKDPFYRFLHAGGGGRDGYLCLAINVIARLGLLAIFGPIALAGNVLGSIGAFIAPLLVNSICHMPRFGYQNYKTTDLSQNVWFVALASFGEGWHNNHHQFPQSARHGLKPIEFDFSWFVLSALSNLGLARNIRLPKFKTDARAQQVFSSEDRKTCELVDSLSSVWSEKDQTENEPEVAQRELTRR